MRTSTLRLKRAVRKGGKIEITAEFTIDAHQHIEIEACGNASGVVISVIQDAFVLFEVDADDHLRAFAQDLARAAQEGAGLVRFEIAKRRARKESNLGHT